MRLMSRLHIAKRLPACLFVHGALTHAVSVQRVIVYPAYIDVKKTVAQGRKVAKSKGESISLHCCGSYYECATNHGL